MASYVLGNTIQIVHEGGAILMRRGRVIDSTLDDVAALERAGAQLLPADAGALSVAPQVASRIRDKGIEPSYTEEFRDLDAVTAMSRAANMKKNRPLVCDVRDEAGAAPDWNISNPNPTDFAPAFEAAIKRAAAGPAGGVVVVPPDANNSYFLGSPVEVARGVKVLGSAGAFYGHGMTRIQCAPGLRAAFKILNAFQSADGGNGEGAIVRGFDIQCVPTNTEVPLVLGNTFATSALLLADAYHARYNVLVGGTLDPSVYPSIRDNAHVPDPSYPYVQGMLVPYGRLVRDPLHPALQFQAFGGVLTQPGQTTTAGPKPTFDPVVGHTTTGADGIVWTTQLNDSVVQSGSAFLQNVQMGGIEVTARCVVKDCIIRGPQTKGWSVYGSGPTVFGSDGVQTHFDQVCTILQAGQWSVGCYTRGGSLRGCSFDRIFVIGTAGTPIGEMTFAQSISDGFTATGECGIVAEAYTTGSTWTACFVQYCQGLDYWAASGASRDFFNASVTDGGRVRLDGGAIWIGPATFSFYGGGSGISPTGGTVQASGSVPGGATPVGTINGTTFGSILARS